MNAAEQHASWCQCLLKVTCTCEFRPSDRIRQKNNNHWTRVLSSWPLFPHYVFFGNSVIHFLSMALLLSDKPCKSRIWSRYHPRNTIQKAITPCNFMCYTPCWQVLIPFLSLLILSLSCRNLGGLLKIVSCVMTDVTWMSTFSRMALVPIDPKLACNTKVSRAVLLLFACV